MGPGTGNWGLFEAEDAEVAQALLAAAEGWLTAQGMTRSLGPLSISIWDEPGLLVEGFDTPPTIMLGHNSPLYRARSEEHTSELQSLMRNSYAVFCLKKKTNSNDYCNNMHNIIFDDINLTYI